MAHERPAAQAVVGPLDNNDDCNLVMEVEEGVRSLLSLFHPRPNSEAVAGTPGRVLRAYREVTRGYEIDPSELLATDFDSDGYDQVVALAGIRFYSTCEHHLLPFFGTAGVAYIPQKRVVGLSKLARLVDCFSRRFQIQERMTKEIADALERNLSPLGLAVLVEGQHMCMMARGVMKETAVMRTSDVRGVCRDHHETRQEVLGLLTT